MICAIEATTAATVAMATDGRAGHAPDLSLKAAEFRLTAGSLASIERALTLQAGIHRRGRDVYVASAPGVRFLLIGPGRDKEGQIVAAARPSRSARRRATSGSVRGRFNQLRYTELNALSTSEARAGTQVLQQNGIPMPVRYQSVQKMPRPLLTPRYDRMRSFQPTSARMS